MIKSKKASQGGMCLPQGTDEKPVQWKPPRSHNATAQKELAREVEGKRSQWPPATELLAPKTCSVCLTLWPTASPAAPSFHLLCHMMGRQAQPKYQLKPQDSFLSILRSASTTQASV